MNMTRDRILIVDDDSLNLNVLKDLLEPNYDILAAKNGEQALKITFSASPPDLILLDIMMPGMNGYQVLERVKADHLRQEIPVIFITAMGHDMDEAKGLELGAVDYIVKPISPPIVLARVANQLALKKSLEEQKKLNRALAKLNDELADKNSQLLELNSTLKNMASIDGLTGLPNRRRFDEFLEQEWNRAMRTSSPLSLILMDVDCFKLYNDNYGHVAGDDVLRSVAHTLTKTISRSIEMIARYGGEEFVCVLPETKQEGMILVGNRLREQVANLAIPHAHSKAANHVTISLGGVSLVPTRGMQSSILTLSADKNLYKAKENGRNQLVA
ncbi:MAG: diguanylate cyclase [Magnetococcales bacterium]|nr:diguanylate cyclase [Magnetococcales bacterium]MBF0439437.1 diguanylate cyclase [Magnetococcales bacterium]